MPEKPQQSSPRPLELTELKGISRELQQLLERFKELIKKESQLPPFEELLLLNSRLDAEEERMQNPPVRPKEIDELTDIIHIGLLDHLKDPGPNASKTAKEAVVRLQELNKGDIDGVLLEVWKRVVKAVPVTKDTITPLIEQRNRLIIEHAERAAAVQPKRAQIKRIRELLATLNAPLLVLGTVIQKPDLEGITKAVPATSVPDTDEDGKMTQKLSIVQQWVIKHSRPRERPQRSLKQRLVGARRPAAITDRHKPLWRRVLDGIKKL